MNNVINLKDYSKIYEKDEKEYKFVKAYSTNSRLMGVIGLRLHYISNEKEKLTLFFHLDFEEYGFDRFEVIVGEKTNEIENFTQSIMGGLGAKLVDITLKDASTLIYTATDVGTFYSNDLPIDFFEYEYLIEDFCGDLTKELCSKVCSVIRTDVELINYYVMRTVGMDYELRDFLLSDKELDYLLVDEPTVLLKNVVTKEDDHYIIKSIIDHLDSYKMIISEATIKNDKILSCKKVDEMLMTSREASFQLNKSENLLIMYVESPTEFKMFIERSKPELLKNIYDSGTLYTEFNKTNEHVNKDEFYLNGDVYGTYYMTDHHHLVISCFNKKDLKEIKEKLLDSFPEMNELAELEAEIPIIYNFVTSQYLDFFDFLGE